MNKQKYKGITLIEVVVYLALFALIFVGVVQFLIAVADNNTFTQNRIEIDRYKIYLYQHLEESLDWASQVDGVSSTFDSDNGVLVLKDTSVVPEETLTYSLNSGKVEVNRGGVILPVTPANVTVSKLRFEDLLDNQGNVVGVVVTTDFSLNNSSVAENITHTYRLY